MTLLRYTTMNKEIACIMICIVSKNFAKTLDMKREFDVTVWRHKQRTPSNDDHHTPLILRQYSICLCNQARQMYWTENSKSD